MKKSSKVPPSLLELILPILCLRHAIHVVYKGSNLYPLTEEELSLVEEIMSRKFSLPFVKEALKQRKMEKRKQALPEMSVLDDHPAT